MNVARQVTIRVSASAWNLKPDWPERAQRALTAMGCEEVTISEGGVHSARGTLGAGHILPCDGRRRQHAIAIDVEGVTYTIDTFYALFTDADEAVFEAEARLLLSEMSGTPQDASVVAEAEELRSASDFKVTLMMACAVGLGIILLLVAL